MRPVVQDVVCKAGSRSVASGLTRLHTDHASNRHIEPGLDRVDRAASMASQCEDPVLADQISSLQIGEDRRAFGKDDRRASSNTRQEIDVPSNQAIFSVDEALEHGDDEGFGDSSSLRRILAKVIRLEHVSKHPSAEHLNVAQIGGWKAVVAPDEVAGTLGVFFEIDSVLPAQEDWVKALPMPSKSKFQVRSVKIRGCLSQGLFVGMHKLPLPCSGPADEEKWLQTGDVTALLGITKRVEPAISLKFKSLKLPAYPGKPNDAVRIPFSEIFPDGPDKTDEFRVQSFMHLLDEMMGKTYYMTVKVDGMSVTYGYDETRGGFVACSRNYMVELDDTVLGELGKTYGLAEKLNKHPNLVIQGEAYGPGVNKNLLQAHEMKLAVFNVYNKETRRRLPYAEMVGACQMLNLPMVPLEEVGDEFNYTLDELLQKAKGFYQGTKNHREGLVVRCQEQYGENGLLSFKVINNDFLLRHGR